MKIESGLYWIKYPDGECTVAYYEKDDDLWSFIGSDEKLLSEYGTFTMLGLVPRQVMLII